MKTLGRDQPRWDVGDRAERRHRRPWRIVSWLVTLCLLNGAIGLGGVLILLNKSGHTPRQWSSYLERQAENHRLPTPRQWAPYLERRADGHRPSIVETVGLVSWWLNRADWLAVDQPLPVPASLGASPDRSGPAPPGRLRSVDSAAALEQAVGTAQPGDVIQLAPGHYELKGGYLKLVQPGTETAPITLRAARLGDVVIRSPMIEVFKVSAPYWHFANLVVRGMGSWCDHAIHIVGGATHVLVRNNRFEDFNAALKINGEDGKFPDAGVIEGNSFTFSKARETGSPITPIDLDAASGWDIRDNLIADFQRAWAEGGATYGAYAKGAGANNVFERNLVICQWKLRHAGGQQVGISLGGGGTGPQFMRDLGRSGIEQFDGVIRDNLIVSCGDAGIYLNRAARSVVDHNTLIDTAGIEARFPQSAARVTDNIVDGTISTRDDAIVHASGNLGPNLLGLFLGWHPARGYFRDPAKLDLTWRERPPSLPNTSPGTDLCGYRRGSESPPGAFDDFARCLAGH